MKPVAEKLVSCAAGIKQHPQDCKWLRDIVLQGAYAELVRLDVFKLSNIRQECRGLLRGLQARSELMDDENLLNVANTFMTTRALEEAVCAWIQAGDVEKDLLEAAGLASTEEKRGALRNKILLSLNDANKEYQNHRGNVAGFWNQHQHVRQELADMKSSLLTAAQERKGDTKFQSEVKDAVAGQKLSSG